MSVKARNWLLGGLGIAIFILGMPLAQRVVASGNAAPANSERAPAQDFGMEHTPVIRVGEQYLQLVPANDGSVNALLHDSAFEPIAVNENEAALTFTLPDGAKKTVKITVPAKGCSRLGHSSGGAECCAAGAEGIHHENCDHDQKAVQE